MVENLESHGKVKNWYKSGGRYSTQLCIHVKCTCVRLPVAILW